MVQTVDDVGVAGEEFKYCSVYVRGLVWSRLSLDRLDEDPDLIRVYKEQLYPCLQIQPDEDWRPVILVPTPHSVVAVYCPLLALSGKIPWYAHKSRLRLLEGSDDESSTTTDCPISGTDDELPSDDSDRDIGTDCERSKDGKWHLNAMD